jgi:nucleoside-diphosphate-sugar epimerase
MKALIIGGTGNISEAVSREAVDRGFELFLLNRGNTPNYVRGAHLLRANIKSPSEVDRALKGHVFDVVANFIAYTIEDVKQDIHFFRGRTKQYIFVSSTTVYDKTRALLPLRECSARAGNGWKHAEDKITCEKILIDAYEQQGFPCTIVRPAHTYDKLIPTTIGKGMDVIARLRRGAPVVIHDSGNSLWTLTHSSDFARGFVGLMGNQVTIGESFHITSNETLTWNQIYQMMAEAAGAQEYNPVHIPGSFIERCDKSLGMEITRDKAFSSVYTNEKIKWYVPDFVCNMPFFYGIRLSLQKLDRGELPMDSDNDIDRRIDRIINAWQSSIDAGIEAYNKPLSKK